MIEYSRCWFLDDDDDDDDALEIRLKTVEIPCLYNFQYIV